MVEHYPEEVLRRTRGLYETIRSWAEGRDDVSIIGGWLVHEHVDPVVAQQSRDVDIVLHSEEAFSDCLVRLPGWGLALRRKSSGSLQVFPDAHFMDEDPLVFRLDLLTTQATPKWQRWFGRRGANNIKIVPRALFPDAGWLVQDKLATVGKRRGPDASDKRAKDLIDVFHVITHNRHGLLPQDFDVPADMRRAAAAFLTDACATRPEYEEQFEQLRTWLES